MVQNNKKAVYTQSDICARYGISRPTLWRWRQEGAIPEPTKVGKTNFWFIHTITKWEKEGCPKVAESLDESLARRDRAFKRIREISSGIADTSDLAKKVKAEFAALLEEIETVDERRRELIEGGEEVARSVGKAAEKKRKAAKRGK